MNRDDLDKLIWDASRDPLSAEEMDAGWRALRGRMPRRGHTPTRHRSFWEFPVVVGVVSAIVAVALVSLFSHGSAQPFREFSTVPGARSTVTLRDGTRIVLGPDSRLRVPTDFGRAGRRVDLVGEAMFAVVHDAKHPFAVQTDRALTQDVGTTFVVKAYGDDSADQIGVAEGVVSVHGTLLRAGDLAAVTATSVAVTHEATLAGLTAWSQGGLTFEDTPLREVIKDLSHTFGVTVTVADTTLLARRVTATFADQPLTVVLDAITQALGAKYEQVRHTVVIRRNPAARIQHLRPSEKPVLTLTGTQ